MQEIRAVGPVECGGVGRQEPSGSETKDRDGLWWVAAWSGHTQDRVIGHSAIVPAEELPQVWFTSLVKDARPPYRRMGY